MVGDTGAAIGVRVEGVDTGNDVLVSISTGGGVLQKIVGGIKGRDGAITGEFAGMGVSTVISIGGEVSVTKTGCSML